jgi:hypothetical protein
MYRKRCERLPLVSSDRRLTGAGALVACAVRLMVVLGAIDPGIGEGLEVGREPCRAGVGDAGGDPVVPYAEAAHGEAGLVGDYELAQGECPVDDARRSGWRRRRP